LPCEHLPADTTPVTSITIITHHEVSAETGFFVSRQTITAAEGQVAPVDSSKWRDDNRTLINYFAKHAIDITPCSYEADVKSHSFKLVPGQEPDSLVAYQYELMFKDCSQVAERLPALLEKALFPATLDSTHKYPSTLYLLSYETPVSIVSMYGMPAYHPPNVVESVLEYIAQLAR
jgi:hypothetical protein